MSVARVRLMMVAILLIAAAPVFATSVPVANYSFETYTSLPNLCGGSCAYSVGPIPGWNNTGTSGQWITGGYAGNPPAIDGNVLAYANSGQIWQDVATAVAGTTYTLQVEMLHRTDAAMAGVIQLEIGGNVVATATGADGGPGSWNNWTAVYTAAAADAGQTVTILLSTTGPQADFDNVRLDSSVPEPVTMLLLGSGIGVAALRKKFRP